MIFSVVYPAEMFRFRRVLRLHSFEFRRVLRLRCSNGCSSRIRNSTSMVLWPWSLVKTDTLRQIWLRKRCGLTSSSWLVCPMSTVIRLTLTALLLRCPWQQRFFDIQTSANLRKFVLSFVSSISLKKTYACNSCTMQPVTALQCSSYVLSPTATQDSREVFVVFHDDGYTVYEPSHCYIEHQVSSDFSNFVLQPPYGASLHTLCDGEKPCSWGTAINVQNRCVPAAVTHYPSSFFYSRYFNGFLFFSSTPPRL